MHSPGKYAKVVAFESKARLLAQVQAYADSTELFLEDADRAVSRLLRALEYASGDLKRRIVLLLGTRALPRVAQALYEVMKADTDDDIRYLAAVQLNVTASSLENPAALTASLIEDTRHPDPQRRELAALALGWECNVTAAIALTELLFDPDIEVQTAAVNALVNLCDDRILGVLADRLKHGPIEQKRCILFNLNRLTTRKEEVGEMLCAYLQRPDEELRFDALSLLATVCAPERCLPAYHAALAAPEPRVRALALECLGDIDISRATGLRSDIERLTRDPDPTVRRRANTLLEKK